LSSYDAVVLGAGASGMVAAIKLAQNGKSVAIIERQSRGGKKILASGNGRCNIANSTIKQKNYYLRNKKLISELLQRYRLEDIQSFFATLGLEFTALEDGRLFPQSMSALSVLELLEATLKRLNVPIFYSVDDLKVKAGFSLTFGSRRVEAKALIIATGSPAAPQLGGNSSGFALARQFGHSIIEPHPSLVPLQSGAALCKKLSGLRVPVTLHLLVNGEERTRKSGDLLFTKYGISGLAVLDISIEAAMALSAKNSCAVAVDFFPDKSKKELLSFLQSRIDKERDLPLSLWLSAIIHPKLAQQLLAETSLQTHSEVTLKSTQLKALVEQLKSFIIPIESYRPMQYAEVAIGGVNSNEVDAKTLQSKRKEGLYFCGEVLDVVGDRGGYNFYFAWCSAFAVADAISYGK
jgi:predicted Rossmann fold flavoprotein